MSTPYPPMHWKESFKHATIYIYIYITMSTPCPPMHWKERFHACYNIYLTKSTLYLSTNALEGELQACYNIYLTKSTPYLSTNALEGELHACYNIYLTKSTHYPPIYKYAYTHYKRISYFFLLFNSQFMNILLGLFQNPLLPRR